MEQHGRDVNAAPGGGGSSGHASAAATQLVPTPTSELPLGLGEGRQSSFGLQPTQPQPPLPPPGGLPTTGSASQLKSILRQGSGRVRRASDAADKPILHRSASQVSFSTDAHAHALRRAVSVEDAAARRGSSASEAASSGGVRSTASLSDIATTRSSFIRRGSTGTAQGERRTSFLLGSDDEAVSSLSDGDLPTAGGPQALRARRKRRAARARAGASAAGGDEVKPFPTPDALAAPLEGAPTPPMLIVDTVSPDEDADHAARRKQLSPVHGRSGLGGSFGMLLGSLERESSFNVMPSLMPLSSGMTIPVGRSPETSSLRNPSIGSAAAVDSVLAADSFNVRRADTPSDPSTPTSQGEVKSDDNDTRSIGSVDVTPLGGGAARAAALGAGRTPSPALGAGTNASRSSDDNGADYSQNKGALVTDDQGHVMLDVNKLFFDNCTTQGNLSNKYLGYRDMKYWDARKTFGLTKNGQYNSLQKPLHLIGAKSSLRKRLVHIVDSTWFQRLVIAAIFLNAITLAMDAAVYAQRDDEDMQGMQDFLQGCEYFFLAVFTLEAVLKITAMGFCMHIDSYLVVGVREGHLLSAEPNWWNIIDFIIVLLAWAGLHPAAANFSVVRCLRLLRPLKALHRVQGLHVILKALLSSLGPLSDVVVLLLFFMVVFAVIGVLVWEGTWHQRCFLDVEALVVNGTAEEVMQVWEAGAAAWVGFGNATNGSLLSGAAPDPFSDAAIAGDVYSPPLPFLDDATPRDLDGWVLSDWPLANKTVTCTQQKYGDHCNIHDTGTDYLSTCEVRDWRRSSFINFDNTGTALLLLFKVISLDDWPDDMELAAGAVGQAAFVYFLLVTLFGSFFTMNLVLAILCGNFADISDEIREEQVREQMNEKLHLYNYRVTIATLHFNYMRLAIAVYGGGMKEEDGDAERAVARMMFVFAAIKEARERSQHYAANEGGGGHGVAGAGGGGDGGGNQHRRMGICPGLLPPPPAKKKRRRKATRQGTDRASTKQSRTEGEVSGGGSDVDMDPMASPLRAVPTLPALLPRSRTPSPAGGAGENANTSAAAPTTAARDQDPGEDRVVEGYAQHSTAAAGAWVYASDSSDAAAAWRVAAALDGLNSGAVRVRGVWHDTDTDTDTSTDTDTGAGVAGDITPTDDLACVRINTTGGRVHASRRRRRRHRAAAAWSLWQEQLAAAPAEEVAELLAMPACERSVVADYAVHAATASVVNTPEDRPNAPPALNSSWLLANASPGGNPHCSPASDRPSSGGAFAATAPQAQHFMLAHTVHDEFGQPRLVQDAAMDDMYASEGSSGNGVDNGKEASPHNGPNGGGRNGAAGNASLRKVSEAASLNASTTGGLSNGPGAMLARRLQRDDTTTLDGHSPVDCEESFYATTVDDRSYAGSDDDSSSTFDSDYSVMDDEQQTWYNWRSKKMRSFVRWKWFARFVVFVITFNVAVMCVDHHPISATLEEVLEWTSFACNIIFIVEMVLKILGLSVRGYFLENWNTFDFVLVMISLPEMATPFISARGNQGGGSGITALRALRALRVTRLLNRSGTLRTVVTTVLRSVRSAIYLCLIMLLFIFVFSVLGVQLFAASFPEEERNNFRGLWQACITVFVVITGEQWAYAMHVALEATSPAAFIYFVAVFSLGNYIFMNLFIAILIDNFAYQHEREVEAARQREEDKQKRLQAKRRRDEAKVKFIAEIAQRDVDAWNAQGDARRLQRDDSAASGRISRHNSRNTSLTAETPTAGAGAGKGSRRPRTNSIRSAGSVQFDLDGETNHEGQSGGGGTVAGTVNGSVASQTSMRQTSSMSRSRSRRTQPAMEASPVFPAGAGPGGDAGKGGARVHSIRGLEDLIDLPRPDSQRTARRDRSMSISLPQPDPIGRRQSTRATVVGVSEANAGSYDSDGMAGPNVANVDVCRLRFFDFTKDHKPRRSVTSLVAFEGKSLFVFAVDNPLRVVLTQIVTHEAFDWVILFLIFCSCVLLALDGPWVDGYPRLRRTLDVSEIVFALLFAVEAVVKIIAFGFVGDDVCKRLRDEREEDEKMQASPSRRSQADGLFRDGASRVLGTSARSSTENSPASPASPSADTEVGDAEELHQPYIWSPWNRVDFVVSILSLLGLFVHFFAMFRALRSLRLIIRNGNIKVVVRALFNALPAIAHVMSITFFVFIIFSILGVQLFKGKMYYCTDPSVYFRTDCVGNFSYPYCSGLNETDCPEFYCEWSRDHRCVSVADDIDVFGDPMEPLQNVSREWVNSRFNFDHLGHAFLALFQVGFAERWADILWLGVDATSHDHAVSHPRSRDSNPGYALFFIMFVVIGTFFCLNIFIGLLIDRFTVLRNALQRNIFLLPEQHEWLQSQKNLGRVHLLPVVKCEEGTFRSRVHAVASQPWFDRFICLCIVGNAMVMMTRHYRQSHAMDELQDWANFGFALLFILEAAVKVYATRRAYFVDKWNRFDFLLVLLSIVGWLAGTTKLQVFRIFRIARMLRLIRRFRGLYILFGTLFYSLPSLMNIGFLLLCVYFNFAVIGIAAFGRVNGGPFLSKWINFKNIGNAIVTLYTISTGEKWNDVMEGVSYDADDCEEVGDCGANMAGSAVFFMLFMVTCGLITLNLFITVVLENFNDQQHDSAVDALSEFRDAWSRRDPDAHGWLHINDFVAVVREQPLPIGLQRPQSLAEMAARLRYLAIPVTEEGKVRYTDALRAVSFKLFGITEQDLPKLKTYLDGNAQNWTFNVWHLYAALRIQQRWWTHVKRRRVAFQKIEHECSAAYAAALAIAAAAHMHEEQRRLEYFGPILDDEGSIGTSTRATPRRADGRFPGSYGDDAAAGTGSEEAPIATPPQEALGTAPY